MAVYALIGLAPLFAALAIAAVIDFRQRRIPNWLTFGLMAAGLGRAAMIGSVAGVQHALLGIVIGGAIPLVLYMISALGGGDVKLLAAIGAWLGAGLTVRIFMVEAILGLIVVLIQAAAQRRTGALLRNSAVIAANFAGASEIGLHQAIETGKACKSISRPLPFAVPVFFATLIVVSIDIFVGS